MTDERLEIGLEPILDTLKIEGIEGNWPKSASLGCFFFHFYGAGIPLFERTAKATFVLEE